METKFERFVEAMKTRPIEDLTEQEKAKIDQDAFEKRYKEEAEKKEKGAKDETMNLSLVGCLIGNQPSPHLPV